MDAGSIAKTLPLKLIEQMTIRISSQHRNEETYIWNIDVLGGVRMEVHPSNVRRFVVDRIPEFSPSDTDSFASRSLKQHTVFLSITGLQTIEVPQRQQPPLRP